jgi:hydrogenase expression/formation protein HypC
MCLAVPLQITSMLPNGFARGEHSHVQVEFSVALLENPQVGDFVLVHAGVAIETLDEQSARETLSMLKEVVDGSQPR